MIFILLFSFQLFAQDFGSPAKVYPPIVEQELKVAANRVTFAKAADSVLLKLIKDKNAILLKWLEDNKLVDAPEDAIAKAWRTYYLKTFVIDGDPTNKPEIQRALVVLAIDLQNKYFVKEKRDQIAQSFQIAKNKAIDRTRKQQTTNNREKLIKQLVAHKINWPQKLDNSPMAQKPRLFFNESIIADHPNNQLFVGLGLVDLKTPEKITEAFLKHLTNLPTPTKDQGPES